MSSNKIYLRRAKQSDANFLFEWMKDKETPRNTFDIHIATYEDYSAWFAKMMADPDQVQYILMDSNTLCGQIRLSIQGEEAEIDYSISKSVPESGYGKEIIRLIVNETRESYPMIKKLIGKVKISNVASYYCFEKNGFEENYHQMEFDLIKNDVVNVSPLNREVDVLFLTNNRNTLGLFDWISERCTAEIYSDRLTVDYLACIKPKIVISYNYIFMISEECINYLNENIINLHISLLPWNRGFSPNIWSFIDNTPKGVSIHMLSAGLDEGDILFQKEVLFDAAVETFQTTHSKLNNMIVELFKENWDSFATDQYKQYRTKQNGIGSYHTIADLKKLKNQIPFEWSDNINTFLERYNEYLG